MVLVRSFERAVLCFDFSDGGEGLKFSTLLTILQAYACDPSQLGSSPAEKCFGVTSVGSNVHHISPQYFFELLLHFSIFNIFKVSFQFKSLLFLLTIFFLKNFRIQK